MGQCPGRHGTPQREPDVAFGGSYHLVVWTDEGPDDVRGLNLFFDLLFDILIFFVSLGTCNFLNSNAKDIASLSFVFLCLNNDPSIDFITSC